MATVTALRERSDGRVAVDVDGAPWRVVPVGVVVRSRLAVGRTLDRESLRTLRRELRRSEALNAAARTLQAQDRSRRELDDRLARADIAPTTRAEALAVLERNGLIDDMRFAESRAAALAARGYGDAAISADLGRRGVDDAAVRRAIDALPAEVERAAAVITRRGHGCRTARYLASKGFSEDAIEAASGADFASDL
jgi:regulatory protein